MDLLGKKGITKILMIFSLVGMIIFVLVPTVHSAGIVPCGDHFDDPDQAKMCTLCHLIVGIQNIFYYAFKIIVFVGLTALVVAGIIYIVSTGDESMMTMAKGFIKNVLTGFAFVILAWLIVNTIFILFGVNFGIVRSGASWTKFECSVTSVQYVNPNEDPRANCTGTKPANATACSAENPANQLAISLSQTCPAHANCVYTCNAGYMISGNTCVSNIDARANCTGTKPENGEACDNVNPSAATPITLVDQCYVTGQCLYKCKAGYNLEVNGSSKSCVKDEDDRAEGEHCGTGDAGTCMKKSGLYSCPSGYQTWYGGSDCDTMQLKCCIQIGQPIQNASCINGGSCYPDVDIEGWDCPAGKTGVVGGVCIMDLGGGNRQIIMADCCK